MLWALFYATVFYVFLRNYDNRIQKRITFAMFFIKTIAL